MNDTLHIIEAKRPDPSRTGDFYRELLDVGHTFLNTTSSTCITPEALRRLVYMLNYVMRDYLVTSRSPLAHIDSMAVLNDATTLRSGRVLAYVLDFEVVQELRRLGHHLEGFRMENGEPTASPDSVAIGWLFAAGDNDE